MPYVKHVSCQRRFCFAILFQPESNSRLRLEAQRVTYIFLFWKVKVFIYMTKMDSEKSTDEFLTAVKFSCRIALFYHVAR